MAYTKTLHGSDGAFTPHEDYSEITPSTNVHFYEWHATIARDLIEDSGFDQSTNWKQNVGGLYDLKGTAVGTIVVGAWTLGPGLDATHGAGVQNATFTSGDFSLQAVTGDTYTFAGIISSWRVVTRKPDRVILTVSFESHAAVAVNG